MRVLVVLLSVGFAGTERHAIELANGLAEVADVAVVLRRPPGAGHDQAPYAMQRRALSPAVRVFLCNAAIPAIGVLAAIACFRPDVIHAHADRSARIASRTARLFGVPVVATLHLRYGHAAFARCAGLIALTEAERTRAALAYDRPIALVENWVQPWARPSPERIAALRAEFGIPEGCHVVGSIGRLEPVKRIGAMIEAFAAARLPNSLLLIVGAGGEHASLMAQIDRLGRGAQVRLAGFRPDARDFYALFDQFVLNSAEEPYGLVLLEAAEQRVPVIATATDGARAVALRTPITLIDIDDAAMLTHTLRHAFAAPRKMASALTGFTLADRLPDLLAFYRRIYARV